MTLGIVDGIWIGYVELDGGNGLWGGFNNDSGTPDGTPALELDNVGEPFCVVFWGGEGNKTAAGAGVGECCH